MSSIFNNTNDDNNNNHNNNNNNDNNYGNDNGYDVFFNTFITTCIHERPLVQPKSPSLHVRSLEWFIKHELCVLTPRCWCLTEMVGWSCRVFTSRVCQVVHTSYEDRRNKEYIPGSAWSLIWWSTKLSKCWQVILAILIQFLAILVELIQSQLDPCHPLLRNLCQWEAKSRPILKFRENISIFLISMREIRWSNIHLFASFKQRVQHIYFFNLSFFGTGKCVQPS